MCRKCYALFVCFSQFSHTFTASMPNYTTKGEIIEIKAVSVGLRRGLRLSAIAAIAIAYLFAHLVDAVSHSLKVAVFYLLVIEVCCDDRRHPMFVPMAQHLGYWRYLCAVHLCCGWLCAEVVNNEKVAAL